MRKVQTIFILFVIILLIAPWFNIPEVKLHGWEAEISVPLFSWREFKRGKYQDQISSWWSRSFHGRSILVILKNDIYEILNIGQFHSSFSNNLAEGRSGVIHHTDYIAAKLTQFNLKNIEKNISDIVATLTEIRNRLKYIDKEFLFVMAPTKVDAREDTFPKLWSWRAKHIPPPINVYPVWEKKLKEQNIIYVDGLMSLQQKDILQDSFPDMAMHWSMLAAGTAWEQAVKSLRAHGVNIPPITIKRIKTTDKAYFELEDAYGINIFPRYNRGRKNWKLAEYDIIPESDTSFLIIGDSFAGSLCTNIIQSGFNNVWLFSNRMPNQKEFFDLLEKSNILILVYTYSKAHINGPRIKNDSSRIVNFFNDIYLEEWQYYDNVDEHLSKDKSYIYFLCTSDDNYELLFTLKSCFESKEALFTVNGKILKNINLKQVSLPSEVKVPIPRNILHKGVNKIELEVKNAMTPIAATQGENRDIRRFGILCSDIRVQRSLSIDCPATQTAKE